MMNKGRVDRRRLTILLALLMSAAAAVAAQTGDEAAGTPSRRQGYKTEASRHQRLSLLDLNEELESPLPLRSSFDRPETRRSGNLTRFTRIAGMFMGRVSALSLGSVRICFDLDLR